MKYLLLSLVLLSGCATIPSEYHQGCYDGVVGLAPQLSNKGLELSDTKNVEDYCDVLEQYHNQQHRLERELVGHKN